MVTSLMLARMRQVAALGRRITCALRPCHNKEKPEETEEEDRIPGISGIIVRLADEKLTYSGHAGYGISQTNVPL